MAYSLAPGAIVEFTIESRVNEQRCLSLFHYRLTTGTTADGKVAVQNLTDLLNSGSSLVGNYLELLAENCTLAQIRGQAITPTRYAPVVRTPYTFDGQRTGECNNPSVAAVLTKQSEVATRRGRGALHMPGIPDGDLLAGYLAGTYITAMNALGDKVMMVQTASPALTWTPVIFNRDTPSSSLTINGYTSRDTARTMRRRVVGRGI